jgi:hypothetical protein
MDILVALAVAFLQLASLTFEQLRQTVDAIVNTVADEYVEPAEGIRVGRALSQELEEGRLTDGANAEAFAAAVQRFLQAETRDRHLLVWHGARRSTS